MNKKIITIIFTLSTMLFLVGCSFTNNESNGSDKNYTYNDLDENQKEIIDNVYAELALQPVAQIKKSKNRQIT